MKTQTIESQNTTTPQSALDILKEGNDRFLKGQKSDRNLMAQVEQTAKGQFPYAIILSCIDSRVPVEHIFDLGIGDVFNVKIAGNFVNEDILGSMEFACKAAGSKLIVVLGHSACGAVKGTCDKVDLGNLTGLLSKIQPAVDAIEETGDRSSANTNFVQKVAEKNVELTLSNVSAMSPVLKEMLDKNEIGIVGGMYSAETGKVFFEEL